MFNEARARLARVRVNTTRPAADLPAPQPTPFLEPPARAQRAAATLALEEDGDYLLFGDFPYSDENPDPDEEPADPGFILADDALRVFLNGEQIYESEDTFAQTTEPPISFDAEGRRAPGRVAG